MDTNEFILYQQKWQKYEITKWYALLKSKSQQMTKYEKYYELHDNISQQTPNNYAKYGARSKWYGTFSKSELKSVQESAADFNYFPLKKNLFIRDQSD